MGIEQIKKIGVVGSGLMGAQIAEVASRVGEYPVTMWDMSDELLQKGHEAIRNTHKRFFIEKGKLTAQQSEEIIARIKGTTDMAEVAASDFIIEAIVERMPIKQKVFKQLDELAPAHTCLSTNTSYLNVSDIASATQRPDRVVGTHFFNPPAMMKLLEVIRGTLTSEATAQLAVELGIKLGKEPVLCKDVSYGFIANRTFRAMRNEAVRLVWERVATPRDIDKAMKLGFNHPMGPLELSDMTGGWGIAVSSEEDAIRELGPVEGRVPQLIKVMVRAGYPGGRGKKGMYAFYDEVFSKW
ncbi:MAG: 3-hydroxyacyl-CoA dehydrogenase family protein [Chloroflexi bacterium]|nr:3-hydroxyacyl-CoA dehydrogenase family protein [Chloroflexota bacterium]